MLLSLVLRNTFDIFKMAMVMILSMVWILFWLITKRADYLVSRGTLELIPHTKIVCLLLSIATITFIISYVFLNLF